MLIASFSSYCGLTRDAKQLLLDTFSALLPRDASLPKTVYLFEKIFPPNTSSVRYNCPGCTSEMRELPNDKLKMYCDCDERKVSKQDLKQLGCYSIHVPIEEQLRRLLQDHNLGQHIDYRFKRAAYDGKTISDVYDGRLYREFDGGRLMKDPHALSLLMNTDGAPVFNSLKTSIWPIYYVINELPPDMRKKFPLLGGLQYGPTKPNINGFLRSTTSELKVLSSDGFFWEKEGQMIKSTVHLISVCVDSVARAMVQNFTQFNGSHGCPWCLSEGKQMKTTGGGTVRVYPYEDRLILRTKQNVHQHATAAIQNGVTVMGVNGPSILSSLPHFDIAQGLVYDSLHGQDLGVFRHLGALWFDSSNSKAAWYIGKPASIKAIDERALKIKPPGNITRLYRSLSQRAFWKGSEWKNWFLFYAPFVLRDILKPSFYHHFLLLSEACFILNQTTITKDDLFRAGRNIELFVEKFQSLYTLRNMSFNIHLLLHCIACVNRWGPLWAYSAYGFEDMNGKLLQMYNGTQAVELQIVQKFFRFQFLKAVIASRIEFSSMSKDVVSLFKRLLGEFTPTQKHVRNSDNSVFIGTSKEFIFPLRYLTDSSSTADVLKLFVHPLLIDPATREYSKMLTRHNSFTICGYKPNSKRQNCYVLLKNLCIYEIVNFTSLISVDSNKSNCVILGKKLFCNDFLNPSSKLRIAVVYEFGPMSVFSPSDIESKCILLSNSPNFVLALLPNLLDRD